MLWLIRDVGDSLEMREAHWMRETYWICGWLNGDVDGSLDMWLAHWSCGWIIGNVGGSLEMWMAHWTCGLLIGDVGGYINKCGWPIGNVDGSTEMWVAHWRCLWLVTDVDGFLECDWLKELCGLFIYCKCRGLTVQYSIIKHSRVPIWSPQKYSM